MQALHSDYSYLLNPTICCPRSCQDYCNECNGNEALQPEYCSVYHDRMCYQGNGNNECCAASIDKFCRIPPPPIDDQTTDKAPCRLCNYYHEIYTHRIQ